MVAKKNTTTTPEVKKKTVYLAVYFNEGWSGDNETEEFNNLDDAKEKVEEWITENGADADSCKVYEVVRELKRKVIWE